MLLILLNRYWFGHIPLVRSVKFQFLAKFKVDPLSHTVVSNFILFCAYLQHSLILSLLEFFTSALVFHWSLRDSKSPQVSRTLRDIQAVLNNIVVWIVSIRPPTSKSSSPFSNSLVTVPNVPITIGIIVSCMFYSFCFVFFNSLARSKYLSFFSHSFSFILWSAGTAKSTILQFLFFYWLLFSLVFWPRFGDPFICPSPIGVYMLFSRTGAVLCITFCWFSQI